jgi:SAM-dependent methyltransferase
MGKTMRANNLPTCPACLESALKNWFEKPAGFVSYPILRCRSCGGAFVVPRPSQETLTAFYGEHYRREAQESPEEGYRKALEQEAAYPNSTLDAARMVGFCKKLASGNRLLDVGAGFGFFSREAVARGFKVVALEPAPFCRDIFFQLNGFHAAPKMLDAAFAREHGAAFDVVIMSQVLEHLPDLDEALGLLGTLLAPGGLAAIAVPHFRSAVSRLQGRGDMFIAPPEHLNFFTLASLVRLFNRNGFQAIHAETVSRFDPRRIKAKLGFIGAFTVPVLKGALRLADAASSGMYLNVYFRKA